MQYRMRFESREPMWKTSERAKAIAMRAEGATYRQIGDVIGRTAQAVKRHLQKLAEQ